MRSPGTVCPEMGSPNVYLAITIAALLVALLLALQVVGTLFKLVFIGLIAAVGYAAFRAWRGAVPR
ncbi:MAG: hypothetical protein WDZ37_07295 [Solirubrobacterales bacterium]